MELRASGHYKRAKANAPLALMRVDGTRIRQKIKREYEKVLRDLEKAREELDRFQKEDLPQFSRWVNSQFGSLLTELRETTHRVRELEQLFLEIETEMLFSDAAPHRAYARVMDRRKNSESPPEASAGGEEERSWDRGPNGESDSSHFHQDYDDAEPDFDEFFGSGRKKKPIGHPGNSTTATAMGRLKELYRALARRLHPDAQKNMTAQKQEWWHQAQAAYEKGDVEQLVVILSLCEIEETGTTARTSLSALQRISLQLKKSLRQMKAQLSKYRRDPAWNFKRRVDIPALAKMMRRQLNHDLRLLKEQLHSMEAQMAAWAKPFQRPRSPRSRQRPASDPFEFFF